jgi:thiamine biosynthesis protein ThiI
MTSHQHVVVHYGEISLKGKNRPLFVHQLVSNIRRALQDMDPVDVRPLSGRMLLTLPAELAWVDVAERLRHIFGVANFSPCLSVPHHLDAIKEVVSHALRHRTFGSFRVMARRAFKQLPFTSQELNQEIGAHVLENHSTRVDLQHPELTIYIEVIPRQALIYFEKLPGAGGLPMGMSGRLMSLLSGGFDSPVATYRMMKRGCQVDFVHFHSYPFLDRTSQEKASHLANHLTRYQYTARLFLVPFGDIQQQIVSVVPPPARVVLYRRCMLRIAEALAYQRGAHALVTGESLGQVASQTLQNLRVIEAASRLPVLRPLIAMDKAEIMREAQVIGTYETSILPDQDCCTLFVPRHPATRTTLKQIETIEHKLDMAVIMQTALAGMQVVDLHFPPSLACQATAGSTGAVAP